MVKTSGVYARVCGYYRKVDVWNPGKKNEWADRAFSDLKGLC